MFSVALERRVGTRWSVQLSVAASVGGDVMVGDTEYELLPGFLTSVGGSFHILDGSDDWPFLSVGLTGAIGTAEAQGPTDADSNMFTGMDVRLSLTIGKLLFDTFAPYAVVRGFGGPVFWERHGQSITGSDQNFFQLGGGLLATAGGVVDAYVEVIPLGEQAGSFGLSMSF